MGFARRNVLICCIWLPLSSSALTSKEATWVEVRSPHFTVISDAGEKQAREAAHQFEQFRAVIRQALPGLRVDPGMPTIVFAVKDEIGLKTLLPEFWERKGAARPAGIFQPGLERNYVALRLNVKGEHRYHVVYHEYVHLLVRLNLPPLPLWLNEGLAEFFGHAVISGSESGLGRPSSNQLRILQDRRPLALEELFAVDRDSPHYRDENKATMFYAQSWALTHLLMIGERGAHQQKLGTFVDLIEQEVPHHEAVVRAFGSLKDLDNKLDGYIRHMAYYYLKVATPPLSASRQYTARRLSPVERLTAHGDFYVHTKRWGEALASLEAALQLDFGNVSAHESLGLYFERQGDRQKAQSYFETAARAGSMSPIAHYYAGIAARDVSQSAKAEQYFRNAIELNPRFAAAFTALAYALVVQDAKAGEALAYARKAVELEPGVLSHHLNLANVLMHLREVEEALKIGERVLASATSGDDRTNAESFLHSARRYRDQAFEYRKAQEAEGEQSPKLTLRPPVIAESPRDRNERYRTWRKEEDEAQEEIRKRAEELKAREAAEASYLEKVRSASARGGGSGLAKLEGIVIDAKCLYPAVMEVTIEVKGRHYRLHAANYFNIRYEAIGRKAVGDFQPCSDLQGGRVEIVYIATPGEEYEGEIQAIGIR